MSVGLSEVSALAKRPPTACMRGGAAPRPGPAFEGDRSLRSGLGHTPAVAMLMIRSWAQLYLNPLDA